MAKLTVTSIHLFQVTGLEEGRKIKCHQYWPSSNSMKYGPFVVTLLEEIELTDYTIRTFSISGEGNAHCSANTGPFRKTMDNLHNTLTCDIGKKNKIFYYR